MADQKEELVEVKFLKNVGPYSAGQIVKIPKAEADHVLESSMVSNGERMVENRKAVLLSDAAKLEAKVDVATATQAEMDAAGLKNVVPSPGDTQVVSPEKSAEEIAELDKEAAKEEAKHVHDAAAEVKKAAVEDNKAREEHKPLPSKAEKKK